MIIADENIDARIIDFLRNSGISVDSISEENSGITDQQVIELAKRNDQIILTEDKDFGEWVFAHGITNISVIFLRYEFKNYLSIARIITDLIHTHKEKLKGKFTTVTIHKIRIRNI